MLTRPNIDFMECGTLDSYLSSLREVIKEQEFPPLLLLNLSKSALIIVYMLKNPSLPARSNFHHFSGLHEHSYVTMQRNYSFGPSVAITECVRFKEKIRN